ncbi:MAG: PqqD family peptide modification chaperone [Acidimicrobiales bacterium]
MPATHLPAIHLRTAHVLDRTYRPSAAVLTTGAAGDSVLLDLTRSARFGLDPMGARVWTLLAQGCTGRLAVELVAVEYSVAPEAAAAEVAALVERLTRASLLFSAA